MKQISLSFVIILYAGTALFAQKGLEYTGSAGLYGDFYSLSSDSSIPNRRPPQLFRLAANATVSYKKFSVPFTINLSPQNTSVVTPVDKYKGNDKFLLNPLNQIGIAPKYRWIQLLLGTQVPNYSTLTFGDQPIFGAGLKLSPGIFRFEVFTGTSQQPIEEDTALKVIGAYKRRIISGKIGFGREDASHFYIIGGYAKDDTSSLKTKPVNTLAANGILASVDYRVNFLKKYFFMGEVAASAFNRDQYADAISDPLVTIPGVIFNPTLSSRMDGAAIVAIGKEGKIFGIKTIGKYYGDGYVPLGYPFMQTDRLEVTIEPNFSLVKGRVNFTGSIGQRLNNLTNSRAATATQTIGNANLSTQITDELNLSLNFSNYGFRNSASNDTLKIEMVTMSYGVMPTYMLSSGRYIHLFAASYNHDQFRDYNVINGKLSDNNTNSGSLTYSLAMVDNPLTTDLMVTTMNNKMYLGSLNVNTGSITVGYSFYKKKLTVSLGENISRSTIDKKDPSMQLLTQIGCKVKITKDLVWSTTGSLNIFRAGNSNPNYNFRENLLRTSLIYKLNKK